MSSIQVFASVDPNITLQNVTVTTVPLVSTKMTCNDNWCVNNDIQFSTSNPTTLSLSYKQLIPSSFSLPQFIVTALCGSLTDQTITYSASVSATGAVLPSYFTFNSASFTLGVTSSAPTGYIYLNFTGILHNQVSSSLIVTLNGAAYSPPIFASALIAQTVALNHVVTYQLPSASDPEGYAFKLTTYLSSSPPLLPSYISFDSSINTYTFSPTGFS